MLLACIHWCTSLSGIYEGSGLRCSVLAAGVLFNGCAAGMKVFDFPFFLCFVGILLDTCAGGITLFVLPPGTNEGALTFTMIV